MRDCPTAMNDLNSDLLLIRNCCFNNFLLLNPDKTKLMVFGSRQLLAKLSDFNISLLGKDPALASSAKDLGIVLDLQLTTDDHVLNTTSSCMSSLAQISRVKHVLDCNQLVTVINALVFSKLLYCSTVWSNTANKNICRLQSAQNFAARIVTGMRKFDHITPCTTRSTFPVKHKLFFRDAVMAFKCMTAQAPHYLSDQFTPRLAATGRVTPSCQLLNIPLYKPSNGQRTLYYRMVHIWNNLDSTLKTAKLISTFKFYLKKN